MISKNNIVIIYHDVDINLNISKNSQILHERLGQSKVALRCIHQVKTFVLTMIQSASSRLPATCFKPPSLGQVPQHYHVEVSIKHFVLLPFDLFYWVVLASGPCEAWAESLASLNQN